MLEFAWKRDDIPKIDRMDFMMQVMEKDTSLTAVEYAGRYFTQSAGLKIKPMALEYLKDWWDTNRWEYGLDK